MSTRHSIVWVLELCAMGLLAAHPALGQTGQVPDPFAHFVLQQSAPGGYVPGSHEAAFSIVADKAIASIDLKFTGSDLSLFGPASEILINPALTSINHTDLQLGAFSHLHYDATFLNPVGGTFPAARIDTLSTDGVNWAYEGVATGLYADGSPFSFSITDVAIPEPHSAVLVTLAALALRALPRREAARTRCRVRRGGLAI